MKFAIVVLLLVAVIGVYSEARRGHQGGNSQTSKCYDDIDAKNCQVTADERRKANSQTKKVLDILVQAIGNGPIFEIVQVLIQTKGVGSFLGAVGGPATDLLENGGMLEQLLSLGDKTAINSEAPDAALSAETREQLCEKLRPVVGSCLAQKVIRLVSALANSKTLAKLVKVLPINKIISQLLTSTAPLLTQLNKILPLAGLLVRHPVKVPEGGD